MAHAINSNTKLLSIDITRTHTQMRKSPRGETESKKIEKRKKEENKRKYEKERKKEEERNQ